MKLDKKSKIFIIVLFLIILIPVVIIGSINYAKEQELKNRIENSKTTRTLTLNSISTAITLDELLEIENSKEYRIENRELEFENESNKKDFDIEFANTTFCGADCIKSYFFVDEKLKGIIFDIDTSHWMPKNIYEELVKLNGEPDISSLKEEKLGSDSYTWHGKNATLTMSDDNIRKTIEIIFELNQ